TATERLRRLALAPTKISVSAGFERGRYIDVSFETRSLQKLWIRVRKVLKEDSTLARCSIVVCEGSSGWDDYLLLHHFDSRQKLDKLPSR
ncbi:MAG: hypothetical protein ACREJC_03335, partial [Tepidisphaeraceae bacterium]